MSDTNSRKSGKDNGGVMPLTGHLRELRNRLVVCIVVFFIAAIVLMGFAEKILSFLTDLGEQYGYVYVFIAPQELLLQYFKMSLLGAFCVTFPLILYQIWAFCRPGLTRKENVVIVLAIIFGLLCFCTGVLFAYKITVPFMLHFLIGLNASTTIGASISVQNYTDFLLMVFTIFGCVFEMPLLSTILSFLGILSPGFMRKIRPGAIIMIFVIAAIITPPDVFSQIMVAIPMLGLYELSILLCMIVRLFRRSKEDGPRPAVVRVFDKLTAGRKR